jgi:hypothetical protein
VFAIIIGSHFKGFIIAECFVFFLVFLGLGWVRCLLGWEIEEKRKSKRREEKRRESGCERSVKLSLGIMNKLLIFFKVWLFLFSTPLFSYHFFGFF